MMNLNDEFCIKNDEFCVQNDELQVATQLLLLGPPGPACCPLAWPSLKIWMLHHRYHPLWR